jgi:N-sulfoglucosamine sulfohydrolase
MPIHTTRRTFLHATGLAAVALNAPRVFAAPAKSRPNLLLITADDLNCSSVGVYGCKVKNTTPNIDKLASQGIRFNYAHVTVAVCQPSRGAWMTGRYPHNSGVEGFQQAPKPIPALYSVLKKNGYHVGMLGKVGHSTPVPCEFDMIHDMPDLAQGRDPKKYASYMRKFIADAKTAKKTFFMMANSHDPHRPFAGSDQEKGKFKTVRKTFAKPSKVFTQKEVHIPGFLPELPEVRREMAEYFSSVRRCDDTVGAILAELDNAGVADNTLVMFISDNGMALPFAKTNCYFHSSRTPWIVRFPGVAKPGADKTHFLGGIDVMPTMLDAAGIKAPHGVDGRSFLPVLRGKKQAGREYVFTQFHETAGKRRFPMRAIHSKKFGYLFSPWSNGKTAFRNESQSGRTWKAMQKAAKSDPAIAARVKLFSYRTVEEFYDFENDPNALNNLISDPKYKQQIDDMRARLLAEMKKTGDPASMTLANPTCEETRKQFMQALAVRSKELRKNKPGGKKKHKKKKRRKQ